MPYPNEMAARLHPPSKYDEFRRIHPKGFPEGVDAILGIKDGKSEIQAIRAKKDSMSFSDFKKWLKDNDFEPMKVEDVAGDVKKSVELFSTWTALSLHKGANGDAEVNPKLYISGVVSSDAVDLQGDKIEQGGMEWDYFLKRGWLNYEHLQGPENILGVPTKVEQVDLASGKKGTRIEGYLLMNNPRVRDIVNTAKALEASGTGRTIGYSVEGQVLQRSAKDPKIITKARILNVSITAHPVNPDTSLEIIARSLSAGMESDSMPASTSTTAVARHILQMHPEAHNKEVLMELLRLIDEDETEKSEVGYQTGAQTGSSLSALVPQSLDDELSIAGYGSTKKGLDFEGIQAALQAASEDEDESMDGDESLDGDESQDGEEESMSDHIEQAVRRAMSDELGKMMQAELAKLLDAAKGTPTDSKPMLSLAQLDTLMSKVFPGLPAAQQKAFARKLLSAAKGYYTKPTSSN